MHLAKVDKSISYFTKVWQQNLHIDNTALSFSQAREVLHD